MRQARFDALLAYIQAQVLVDLEGKNLRIPMRAARRNACPYARWP